MEAIKISEGEILFRKGDTADCMYYVKSGKIGIYSEFGKINEKELAALKSGKYFGEMGIIDNAPRSADAVAIRDSELLAINGIDFPEFVKNNTSDVRDIMEHLSDSLRKTNASFKKATRTVEKHIDSGEASQSEAQERLKKISVFSKLAAAEASGKAPSPKSDYAANEVLFFKGDKGSVMFQLLEGEVDFWLNYGKDNAVLLGSAKKGDIFGEMSVIDDQRRSATAVAKTSIKTRFVASSDFNGFLAAYPEDALKILRNLSGKLRKTTEEYISVLKAIADFVAEEHKNSKLYSAWDSFNEYCSVYDDLAAMGLDHFVPMSSSGFYVNI